VTQLERWALSVLLFFTTCGQGTFAQTVVLPRDVLTSMNWLWRVTNTGWEIGEEREFLGCLHGRLGPDTLWIDSWSIPQDLQQLRRAVGGKCVENRNSVGTWHTDHYDGDRTNYDKKTRLLSLGDLATFTGDTALWVTLALWDVDSLDAAVKRRGVIVHPATVVVRE